jgi:Zn-finger protein
MTYEKWLESHANKHKKLLEKLSHLSVQEIIDYFEFDNMVQNEPDFCPLYETNTKCHEIEQLNCYFCACPHFRLQTSKSTCAIECKDGGEFVGPDGFIHQDCSKCSIPHKTKYIQNNFDRDWQNVMKDVVCKKD